jgi:hypothetical protein
MLSSQPIHSNDLLRIHTGGIFNVSTHLRDLDDSILVLLVQDSETLAVTTFELLYPPHQSGLMILNQHGI